MLNVNLSFLRVSDALKCQHSERGVLCARGVAEDEITHGTDQIPIQSNESIVHLTVRVSTTRKYDAAFGFYLTWRVLGNTRSKVQTKAASVRWIS